MRLKIIKNKKVVFNKEKLYRIMIRECIKVIVKNSDNTIDYFKEHSRIKEIAKRIYKSKQ